MFLLSNSGQKTAAIEAKIVSGEIVVPYDEESFNVFIAELNA